MSLESCVGRRFHYALAMTVILLAITAAVVAFSVGLTYYLLTRQGIRWFPLCLLFWVFSALQSRIFFCRASIQVDDAGIAAFLFGFRTRYLPWSNVRKIRKARIYTGRATVEKYTIYEGNASRVCAYFVNLCRNVEFDQEIINVRRLLDELNLQARLHSIPLVLWDVQTAVDALATDRAPDKWKRGTRNILERPVAEF